MFNNDIYTYQKKMYTSIYTILRSEKNSPHDRFQIIIDICNNTICSIMEHTNKSNINTEPITWSLCYDKVCDIIFTTFASCEEYAHKVLGKTSFNLSYFVKKAFHIQLNKYCNPPSLCIAIIQTLRKRLVTYSYFDIDLRETLRNWKLLETKLDCQDIYTLPFLSTIEILDISFYKKYNLLPNNKCSSLQYHKKLQFLFDIEFAVFTKSSTMHETKIQSIICRKIMRYAMQHFSKKHIFPDILIACINGERQLLHHIRTTNLYNHIHPLYRKSTTDFVTPLQTFTEEFGIQVINVHISEAFSKIIQSNIDMVINQKKSYDSESTIQSAVFETTFETILYFSSLYINTEDDIAYKQTNNELVELLQQESFLANIILQPSTQKLIDFVTNWIDYCRDHISDISIYCKTVLIGILKSEPDLIRSLLQASRFLILNTDKNCYRTHKTELQVWKIIEEHFAIICEYSHPEEKHALQNHINMLQSSESIYQDMLIKALHVRYCPHLKQLGSSSPIYHPAIQKILDTMSASYIKKNPSRDIEFWDPYFTMISLYDVRCPLAAANILLHIIDGVSTSTKLEQITQQTDIEKWCSIFIAENIITFDENTEYIYDSTRSCSIAIKYHTHFMTKQQYTNFESKEICLLEQIHRTHANVAAYVKRNTMVTTSQLWEKIPHVTPTDLQTLIEKGILTNNRNTCDVTDPEFRALKWKIND